MSGFIAKTPAQTGSVISNDGFFPDIELDRLRKSMRLDGSVTHERLQDACIAAILSVNLDLASLKNQEHTRLADIPAGQINNASALLLLYQRAVYCMTAAELHERYRNYDSTNQGTANAEELSPGIDDLKRDARFAIRDMLRQARTTVELI